MRIKEFSLVLFYSPIVTVCALAKVCTWQLIHFACTFPPDTVYFFCRSSEQAQGSPLELVEMTCSPPHRAPQPSSSHGCLEEECLGNTPGSSCARQPGCLPAEYVCAE